MKKLSQKEIVINQLLKNGRISRNWCLQNYISRLSAIIQNLEEEGWQFTTGFIEKNYVYTILKCPLKKVVFTLPDGKEIISYEKH